MVFCCLCWEGQCVEEGFSDKGCLLMVGNSAGLPSGKGRGWDTSSWITGGRFYEILLFCDFRSLVPFRKLWERAAARECNMSRCSPLRLFCGTTRAYAVEKWVRRRRKSKMVPVNSTMVEWVPLSGARVQRSEEGWQGIPHTWKVSI